MNFPRRVLLVSALALFAIAGMACSRIQETVNVRVAVAEKPAQAGYDVRPHLASKDVLLISTVTFALNDPALAKEGPSPYVNLENPAKATQFMNKANSIAVTGNVLHVVLDFVRPMVSSLRYWE